MAARTGGTSTPRTQFQIGSLQILRLTRQTRNILYLTLSGFDEGTPAQPGHVFKTTNSLAESPTWSNISTPVNLPHNALVVDPSTPNNIFVGTDLGVWNSPDGGSTWTVTGTGLPSVAVFDLQINPFTGRLVAFTHGRGAFALDPTSDAVFTKRARSDRHLPGASKHYLDSTGGPVHHYELQRSQSISGPFSTIAECLRLRISRNKSDVSYQLRRLSLSSPRGRRAGECVAVQQHRFATTMSYTDNPLMAGSTVIKAQHINELRVAVNAVRATAGLPQASWTDASLPGVFIKAVHITELRQNLNQALQVMGFAIPLYTDQTLNPGLIVNRVHVEEVRQAVK